jgi:hypothetical protein
LEFFLEPYYNSFWEKINKLGREKRKQAGLSRATLEISSEFSSDTVVAEIFHFQCFEVVFHWRSSSIEGHLPLEVIFH